jgi:hypothetical protein
MRQIPNSNMADSHSCFTLYVWLGLYCVTLHSPEQTPVISLLIALTLCWLCLVQSLSNTWIVSTWIVSPASGWVKYLPPMRLSLLAYFPLTKPSLSLDSGWCMYVCMHACCTYVCVCTVCAVCPPVFFKNIGLERALQMQTSKVLHWTLIELYNLDISLTLTYSLNDVPLFSLPLSHTHTHTPSKIRYRKDKTLSKQKPTFPVVTELKNGCAIAAIVHYYCPGLLRLEGTYIHKTTW